MASRFCTFGALLWFFVGQAVAGPSELAKLATPAELYGELFQRVQLERVFPDGKTFVDAVPKSTPAEILERYRQQSSQPQFDLKGFVAQHFEVSPPPDVNSKRSAAVMCARILTACGTCLRVRPAHSPCTHRV